MLLVCGIDRGPTVVITNIDLIKTTSAKNGRRLVYFVICNGTHAGAFLI